MVVDLSKINAVVAVAKTDNGEVSGFNVGVYDPFQTKSCSLDEVLSDAEIKSLEENIRIMTQTLIDSKANAPKNK